MSRVEWNIKDLFEKDNVNNENKKQINKYIKKINNEETYKNESYFSKEYNYKTLKMAKKENPTSDNDPYFIFKKSINYSNENMKLNNKLSKEMNYKLNNRLSIKLNNNLNKNKDSYINSDNDKMCNKYNDANKETKSSGALWNCIKNVYTSFTSTVKKNIFIYDKNLECNYIPKRKSISNNSRLIGKKMKNKKYKDVMLNESSIFSKKKKNDLTSDKYVNKNASYDIRIIKEKNHKNGILSEMNKNKNKNKERETQEKNKKMKSCYYDFLEDDIKKLFTVNDYENVEHSNDKNEQETQRDYKNCKNTIKDNIDMCNIKQKDSSYNNYELNSSSSGCNFNTFIKNEEPSFYGYIESNLKNTKKISNRILNSNCNHSLHNLYNTDFNYNKSFFFDSSDEHINKKDYFINEKKKKSNPTSSSSTENEKKDYHNKHYKDNVLRPYFQDYNKKYSNNNKEKRNKKFNDNDDSDGNFSNSSDKYFTRTSDNKINNDSNKYVIIRKNKELELKMKHIDTYNEKIKNFKNSCYEHICEKKNKEKSSDEDNNSWNISLKNIFTNEENKEEDELIHITDNDDEEKGTSYELAINEDAFENEKESLKNKGIRGNDNDYNTTENYNSFIKNNEEIKKMRNEYKSLIQLIDTFIDENLNGSCITNSVIGKKKCNQTELEKKNFTNEDIDKDEATMQVIDGLSSDNKNKYIIVKYDEDSLIEALEKLRIDKKKKKVEEKEEEKKIKVIKIEKNIFYKCNKKDQYETAIYILNQKNENKVLIEKFNVPLLYSQIKCLIDTRWLNDEVINFYLSMLQEYNEKNVKNDSSYFPQIFTFSTFFFQSLSSNGCYNYCKVSRWTKRKKVDIFSFDLILIPLHVGGNHWTLGSINIKDKKIKLYDSLNMPNKKFFEYIRRYLVDEAKDKKQIEINISTWEYDKDGNSESGIPCQENGYDCGVFTCMFAKCLSFNREFDFNQKDIKEIRLKMVYEISQGYLTF